jgi:hypothetical protein
MYLARDWKITRFQGKEKNHRKINISAQNLKKFRISAGSIGS